MDYAVDSWSHTRRSFDSTLAVGGANFGEDKIMPSKFGRNCQSIAAIDESLGIIRDSE